MPLLSQKEIKERALAFSKEYEGVTSERAEAQTFWNDFFNIFGLSRRRVACFEKPVKMLGDKRGSIGDELPLLQQHRIQQLSLAAKSHANIKAN